MVSLKLKMGGDDYATCAGDYMEYHETFQGKKVYYSEALHRIILNYNGTYQVTSYDYWPTFVKADKPMGGGFHMASRSEADIWKTVWGNYTV